MYKITKFVKKEKKENGNFWMCIIRETDKKNTEIMETTKFNV